jgi:hypothetical protein
MQVYKSLDTVIMILLNNAGMRKVFKALQHFVELFIILQIEVGTQQVMHTLDIMRRFYLDHKWFLVEKLHPLTRVPVIQQEILPDERIPAITLVEI